jgi:hypothetical protein
MLHRPNGDAYAFLEHILLDLLDTNETWFMYDNAPVHSSYATSNYLKTAG